MSYLVGRLAEECKHYQKHDDECVDYKPYDYKECQWFQLPFREHGELEYKKYYRVKRQCELVNDESAQQCCHCRTQRKTVLHVGIYLHRLSARRKRGYAVEILPYHRYQKRGPEFRVRFNALRGKVCRYRFPEPVHHHAQHGDHQKQRVHLLQRIEYIVNAVRKQHKYHYNERNTADYKIYFVGFLFTHFYLSQRKLGVILRCCRSGYLRQGTQLLRRRPRCRRQAACPGSLRRRVWLPQDSPQRLSSFR